MRPLFIALGIQVVLGTIFISLVATGNLPFAGGLGTHSPPRGAPAVAERPGGFDGPAAWSWLRLQLAYGPRPAGSQAERRLADRLRAALPNATFEAVPGGLRNIVATVPGRDPRRYVVVGAHYDTKEIRGFVGANDGAGGTAAVIQLARQLRPRSIGPSVVFILFDGEETPAGVSDSEFLTRGIRGSTTAAHAYAGARAMILLDFVANAKLELPREGSSQPALWSKLRRAAAQSGVGAYFPNSTGQTILDDQTPFEHAHVPSIDLIDWNFPCFHKLCDNLSAVSEHSLYASGEAVWSLLPTL